MCEQVNVLPYQLEHCFWHPGDFHSLIFAQVHLLIFLLFSYFICILMFEYLNHQKESKSERANESDTMRGGTMYPVLVNEV